jgi:hypothetical protein
MGQLNSVRTAQSDESPLCHTWSCASFGAPWNISRSPFLLLDLELISEGMLRLQRPLCAMPSGVPLWMSYQTSYSLYRISWLLWLLTNDGCDLKAKRSLLGAELNRTSKEARSKEPKTYKLCSHFSSETEQMFTLQFLFIERFVTKDQQFWHLFCIGMKHDFCVSGKSISQD